MGKLFSNFFNFVSPKQEKKQIKAALKKAYPFGEKQQEFEDQAIKSLFKDDHSVDFETLKFIAINLRMIKYNSMLDEDDEDYEEYDSALSSFNEVINNFNLRKEQLDKINKINEIMFKAQSIEDLKL